MYEEDELHLREALTSSQKPYLIISIATGKCTPWEVRKLLETQFGPRLVTGTGRTSLSVYLPASHSWQKFAPTIEKLLQDQDTFCRCKVVWDK